jgi:hypothetical protein
MPAATPLIAREERPRWLLTETVVYNARMLETSATLITPVIGWASAGAPAPA